jgi:pimeloyl-ACP methyl ester carboxylesterase
MLAFVGTVVVVYVLLCVYAYARQRALIYYPTPAEAGSIGEAVSLPVSGAVLRLILVRRPGASAVIYFGGNAESVATSASDLAQAVPDRSWVFVNYRGYGGSSGSPSEQALVADALAVFDRLSSRYADVAVVGRSLGSGVAVQLAVARPVSALVLVTPYDSLVSVGHDSLPWLPVSWLAKDRFESVRYAPRVACPTLVMMAENDRVVAPVHTKRLVAAFAAGVVSTVEMPGATHNDIQLWPGYDRTISEFLNTKH